MKLWCKELVNPDIFVIWSQIWRLTHPEYFYRIVDGDWQELELLEEGYDRPLS
jgi:hypothetical protein